MEWDGGIDFESDEDAKMFSGGSCATSVYSRDDEMLIDEWDGSKELKNLPGTIWKSILSHFHPAELLKLRDCGRFFNDILQSDDIWKTSRKIHMQHELPSPMRGLLEAEMLELLYRRRCMFCSTRKDVNTYWVFRIKCCKPCLLNHTTKVKIYYIIIQEKG